jgi:L-rhamnose mutarotase
MIANVTHSEGNTDKMYGYLDGHTDGQKHGMDIMKMKACREFSKILSEICPEMVQTDEDIKAMENVFRKRLED